MIVKTTDFGLDSYIPNRDDAPNSDLIGNEPILQGTIDVEEKNVLVELLGWELYSLLLPELDKKPFNPSSGDDADQIWIDLVNGKDNYRGMKDLLVGYIFFQFLKTDNEHYSTVGIHLETSDTSTRADESSKAVANWRKFHEYAIGSYYSNVRVLKTGGVFDGLTGIIYGGTFGGSNWMSMYQFLSENLATYPTWSPSNFENINYVGI